MSRPVWIDRSSPAKARKTLEEFRQAIADGSALMIYPEGTTTRGDVPLLPFKSTAFEAVLPPGQGSVHPILTYYTGDRAAGDVTVAWYDDTPFARHVWGILGNRRTHAKIAVLPELRPAPGMTRKDLANAARNMMESAHQSFLTQQQEAPRES